MIEYKDSQFYNDYCESLKDFTLIEPFVEEKGIYIGKIKPNKSIYELEINVYIPQTFPHNQMTFATRSLSGYPHLIPYYDTPSMGSWFCLNTAFAETAEEQLNEEFDRLREWIRNQLRPELPRHITDGNTISALRTFNIYEGNNADELNEIRDKGDLSFIGDFALNPQNFDKCGYLNVIKHRNGKFTVLQQETCNNGKLPYVIVDHWPEEIHSFASWVDKLKWDDTICKTLLPDFSWGKDVGSSYIRGTIFPSDEELESLKKELSEKDIPLVHKEYIEKEINSLKETYPRWKNSIFDDPDEEYVDEEWEHNTYLFEFHYFAIGVMREGKLGWYLVIANRKGITYDKFNYTLGNQLFTLQKVNDISLYSFSRGKVVEREEYFGRGELHRTFISKKIALIGLGAIGSALAESLIRGGLNELTLWDGDLIEPGNICRSAYSVSDVGNAKVFALAAHLRDISPFSEIKTKGGWHQPDNDYSGICKFSHGEFYGNINYDSQEKFISSLKDYDLLIDCTASNELLHFLSYAAKDVDVLSLCITNQSRDLLCISNHTGNPFELRKHYLSCIEQETGNFYSEGTGCYAPTFLATYSDIQALVNLCVRAMNKNYQNNAAMDSMIWHYDSDSISVQKMRAYKLDNSPITMTITDDSIEKIKRLPLLKDGEKGYLLGGYSSDRTAIYITNIISKINAQEQLDSLQAMSKGIINYIGNICISSHDYGETPDASKSQIIELAKNDNVATNNPLVACVNAEGKVAFSLYIGNEFVPFSPAD